MSDQFCPLDTGPDLVAENVLEETKKGVEESAVDHAVIGGH